MNKLFVAVLLVAAICIAEAKITKRSAIMAQAHHNKLKRGGNTIGPQPGDIDLCPWKADLGDMVSECDKNESYGPYCILTDWKCDGTQDCADNTDEKGCKGGKGKGKGRKIKN